MFTINFYIQCVLPQTVAIAVRALCPATVTAQQHTILDFVKILLNFFKKLINAVYITRSFPQHFILLTGKVSNWFMNRKIYFSCTFYKLFSPPPKLLSFPRSNRAFIHT